MQNVFLVSREMEHLVRFLVDFRFASEMFDCEPDNKNLLQKKLKYEWFGKKFEIFDMMNV